MPSELDVTLFGWLVDLMAPDGRAAVMLIAGDPGTAYYLDFTSISSAVCG